MKKLLSILSVLFAGLASNAQFAPQVGLAGSTAIHKDSAVIAEWASHCIIQRGWQNIADTSLGKAITGDSTRAIGIADGDVVSLGDGGAAVLFFENPIIDGAGPDFAVFENGFRNPADSNMAFLELAIVEVSNDGIDYYPFPVQCNNDTSVQIAGAGVYMDARKINNLAGKYVTYYGTPFDLNELSAMPSLDIHNIRYIRIKDAVGALAEAYCTRDMNNNIINDPYPTPFPTGGFDLDALAVINHKFPTGLANTPRENEISFYPNPVGDMMYFKNNSALKSYKIISMDGQVLKSGFATWNISTVDLKTGIYLLETESKQGVKYVHRLLKI